MGSLVLAQIHVADGSFALTFNAFTAYWSIEVATNSLLTTLIVGKLMYMRYRLRQALGAQQSNPYLTISAMVIESSLLFTVIGIAFIISYARSSPFQNILLTVAGQVQVSSVSSFLAPELMNCAVHRTSTHHHACRAGPWTQCASDEGHAVGRRSALEEVGVGRSQICSARRQHQRFIPIRQ